MNKFTVTCAAVLLAGAAASAATIAQRPRAFDPPSAGQLGLGGADAAYWNELRARTLELRDTARNAAAQRLQALQQLLATPAPDLDAFSRDSERQTDALLAQARALKAQKLAFYARLPAAQQAQARGVMRDRVERLQHLRVALAELAEAAP